MLTGCWLGVDRVLTGCWPGVDRVLTRCWPDVDWVLTGCWPGVDWVLTGCWPGVDWVLTGCWPGVDWVLTRCWLGVDVVKFISTYWLCTLMKHYRTSNQPVMLRNRINMINDLWWYLGSIKLFLGFWVFKMFQSNISVYSPPLPFFLQNSKNIGLSLLKFS